MTVTTGARRLRQPSWRDPRLLIGVLLVLASVAVGARVLSNADRTAAVYVARTTLPAGSPLEAADLSVARFRLTGSSARYLDATVPLPSGLVLQRTVGAGELVPVGALAEASALAARPVGIPLADGVPAGIVPGGLVDIWSAGTRTRQTDPVSTPRRIATAVEVYHVSTAGQGGLAAGRAATVQVLVPEPQLPVVLAALADGSSVSLLPLPGARP